MATRPPQQRSRTAGLLNLRRQVPRLDPHGAMYSLQSFGETFASFFSTPIGVNRPRGPVLSESINALSRRSAAGLGQRADRDTALHITARYELVGTSAMPQADASTVVCYGISGRCVAFGVPLVHSAHGQASTVRVEGIATAGEHSVPRKPALTDGKRSE